MSTFNFYFTGCTIAKFENTRNSDCDDIAKKWFAYSNDRIKKTKSSNSK